MDKMILYHGSNLTGSKGTECSSTYVAGIINANETIERLRSNQINNQVSLHTPAALSRLMITGKYQK